MYHNRVCRGPIRRVRRSHPLRYTHGRCPMQRPNKFDPLSLYGGLHGLSFDPTNTQALLRAVSALQSTQAGRCSIQTPIYYSPCNSSPDSNSSFTRPSTPPMSAPCSLCPGPGRAQSIPVAGPSEACSPGSTASGSSPSDSSHEEIPREKFMREKFLQDKLLEERFLLGNQHCPKRDLSEAVRKSVGTNSSKVLKKARKDLTWIDWGWPGTHLACPFNQRHLVDDSLVLPERVGHVITRILKEVTISAAAYACAVVTSYRNVLLDLQEIKLQFLLRQFGKVLQVTRTPIVHTCMCMPLT
ncbi:hypothetical protein M758_1G018300 [Ceratodon purpureus]|nr:hypothetical protein M758_1G018300 [Ceratodon purpureus]